MKNTEKKLGLGVARRFYNLFDNYDTEIFDRKGNLYEWDYKKYLKAVRKLNNSDLKKEINFQLWNIQLWRNATRKDWGTKDFIDFLTD